MIRLKNIKRNIILLLVALTSNNTGIAQIADSTISIEINKVESNFKISGYVDAYYSYYTDSVGVGDFQKFPTISPVSNQFGINIAVLSAEYNSNKARGIVTLHYGDIPQAMWSSKYNAIMEAHAGIKIHPKIWLDAGLFRTHFGTEGLMPKENLLSSISINTFYEIAFEAGARLNYIPNDKISISLYALNGYNTFEDNNKKKSFGLLATYALSDKGNIGYSNYIGDDTPEADSISHMRIHNNLFMNYQMNKMKYQIGIDYCTQSNSDTTHSKSANMFSGIITAKYQVVKKFAIAARGELFSDPQGFMSAVIVDKAGKSTGYNMWGATLGIEYIPIDNAYIRLEARQIQMDKNEEIFYWDKESTSSRTEFLINMGISF